MVIICPYFPMARQFFIRGRHVNPSARYAVFAESHGVGRRDHHDPRKRRIPKRLSPWVIMVVVGLSNWLYQVCYIMSKLPLCPGISMSLLWISLGNFYNYLGFPKMECFDPTDITRSLGPTFSSRPIFFAGSSCPVTSQRHEHWNREPSSDDWKYMEIHKMARKKLMIVSIKIGGGSEFCAWVSKKASSMGQRSIRFCTRLNTQV